MAQNFADGGRMKYFAVEAAEALIPELEEIFEQVLSLQQAAEAKASALKDSEADKDKAANSAMLRGQLQFLVAAINTELQKICDMGAIPKGLEPPLVDFPYRLEEGEVYLCWKLGDKTLEHYHGLDEGFGGRKPLPQNKKAA
jgi:hypothetical protein